MRTNIEQEALLDRAGKPSLRELLDGMVFSPMSGQISLNGTRMLLQRASFGENLRNELMHEFGREATYVLLTRLGFQAGGKDAEFVKNSWPFLDFGDAITAGIRLHSICGMVRVETLFNDFDFKKGKFAAEFLWHSSLEGNEYCKHHRNSDDPVCWGQVGYAAGYASYFMEKLVVYKEIECAGMGHSHCRVIGKTADVWGEDDETVRLYRNEILPTRKNLDARLRRSFEARPTRKIGKSITTPTLLAPIESRLQQAVKSDLPILIMGPQGSGKRSAAKHLHDLCFGRNSTLEHIACSHLEAKTLRARLTPKPKRGNGKIADQTLVLEDVEQLDDATQRVLVDHLSAPTNHAASQIRLIVTSNQTQPQLAASSTMRQELYYRLAILPISMLPLNERSQDILKLALEVLEKIAARFDCPVPELTKDAKVYLKARDYPGNMYELEAIMTGAFIQISNEPTIDEAMLRTSALPTDKIIMQQEPLNITIAQAISNGGVSLDALNSHAYQAAMKQANGNIAGAARALGLSRAQLAYRLDQNEQNLQK